VSSFIFFIVIVTIWWKILDYWWGQALLASFGMVVIFDGAYNNSLWRVAWGFIMFACGFIGALQRRQDV
jgi:hypothetical protein